jgi:hypothetical protein
MRTQQKRKVQAHFVSDGPIAPGAEATIAVRMARGCRGERLAIDPAVASDFSIVDIRVGRNSQLLSAEEIPAKRFASKRGRRGGLEFETAWPDMLISLRVRNRNTTRERMFAAVLYGTEVEDSVQAFWAERSGDRTIWRAPGETSRR